jgi:hypothetical protein
MTATQDAVISLMHKEILHRDGGGQVRTYGRWTIRQNGKDLILWTRVGKIERVISIGPRGRTLQLNSDDQAELSEMLCGMRQSTAPALTGLLTALGLERRPSRSQLQPPASLVKQASSS